jgi:DNA-binding NarL/FixJ family response regulator
VPVGLAGRHDVRVTRTILLVDDHPEFRRAAKALLGAEGFQVVGEARGGAEAIAAAADLRPDLVLLDIQLPDLDGFEVARRLAASTQRPTVILISSRAAHEFGGRVEAAEVRGFIQKGLLTGAAIWSLLT